MNVAIYGSCVSRDVLRVHPVAPVAAYAARSSWVSALTPPVAEPDADIGLASDFQARMVRDDFASTAPAALDAGDALLLDLTDERFGVIEYGGGFITPSNEFRRSAWNDVVVGRRIPFASDEHVALFRELAPRMKERLRGRRAWVLRARFADVTDTGESVRRSDGRSGDQWQVAFAPYFAVLEELGLPILDVPDELAVASKDHLWGAAAMHYADPFYAWVADRLPDAPTID